jgi:hypothetical protein
MGAALIAFKLLYEWCFEMKLRRLTDKSLITGRKVDRKKRKKLQIVIFHQLYTNFPYYCAVAIMHLRLRVITALIWRHDKSCTEISYK